MRGEWATINTLVLQKWYVYAKNGNWQRWKNVCEQGMVITSWCVLVCTCKCKHVPSLQKNHPQTVLLVFRIPAYPVTIYKCQILAICDLTRENHVSVLFLIRGMDVSVLFLISGAIVMLQADWILTTFAISYLRLLILEHMGVLLWLVKNPNISLKETLVIAQIWPSLLSLLTGLLFIEKIRDL